MMVTRTTNLEFLNLDSTLRPPLLVDPSCNEGYTQYHCRQRDTHNEIPFDRCRAVVEYINVHAKYTLNVKFVN